MKRFVFCLVAMFVCVSSTIAQTITLDYPGADTTMAFGISGNNVVGYYNGFYQGVGGEYGFLYNGLIYSTVNHPNSFGTQAFGISGNNIVGNYYDSLYNSHGFIYNGSTWTTLNYPNAGQTNAQGISGNMVVGSYQNGNVSCGFIYNNGEWTSLTAPWEASKNYPTTVATGVSGNNIVGYTGADSFLYNQGSWTILDDPLGVNGTSATGISGNNVVGYYFDTSNNDNPFLYNIVTGTWTTLDMFGSTNVMPEGIDSNNVVGVYIDTSGNRHGYVNNVPEPSTIALLISGLIATGLFFRRKN